jgi:hypothetical protein
MNYERNFAALNAIAREMPLRKYDAWFYFEEK